MLIRISEVVEIVGIIICLNFLFCKKYYFHVFDVLIFISNLVLLEYANDSPESQGTVLIGYLYFGILVTLQLPMINKSRGGNKQMEKFDPTKKSYVMRLSEYDCDRIKFGRCPLDDMSLEDILKAEYDTDKLHSYHSGERCVCSAKMMLMEKRPVELRSVYHNLGCGHYTLDAGQHQTCIAAKLLKKGASIECSANVVRQESMCRCCSREQASRGVERFFEGLPLWKKSLIQRDKEKYIKNHANERNHDFIFEL